MHSRLPRGVRPRLEGKPRTPLSSRVASRQGPSRPSGRTRGLPLRRRRGQGPHLAKRWEPRGLSRVVAGFSSYDGDLSLPLGLALESPIFPSGCEGKLGVALESLQGPEPVLWGHLAVDVAHSQSGDFWGSQEGCQGPFRPSGRNRGLPLRRRRGQGPHLAKRWEPRGFSRVAADRKSTRLNSSHKHRSRMPSSA